MMSVDVASLCTFRASHPKRQGHKWALEGLGSSLATNSKNWSDFSVHPPLNVNWGWFAGWFVGFDEIYRPLR